MAARSLDGSRIHDEAEFHSQIALLLDFGEHYGTNLDALWDRLSSDVERPLLLVWKNSEESRQAMGDVFSKIVSVLERVRLQDQAYGWKERFDYRLE